MDAQAWLASLSPEAWFAGAAAVIALVALFFTGIASKAAADQTKIQRQLRIDAAQPYVWADIRPETAQAGLLRLEIGNSGPTVATNIRVTSSVPLPASGQRFEERAKAVEQRLRATVFGPLLLVASWPGPSELHTKLWPSKEILLVSSPSMRTGRSVP
jgi:hypothetical protein